MRDRNAKKNRVNAIVAVRGGAHSKSRCASMLSAIEREILVESMISDVLTALASSPLVERSWVVTPTAALAVAAERTGAFAILQPDTGGLNAAFDLALEKLRRCKPDTRVLILVGDLPSLRPQDIEKAVGLLAFHDIVLGPSHDGGTSLIGLNKRIPFTSHFGAGSFRQHARAAHRAGLRVAICRSEGFLYDIDDPRDIRRFAGHSELSATAAFLRSRPRATLRA